MKSKFMHGDCQTMLPTLPAQSVDLMVTDPPYGLQFMPTKIDWDKTVPSVEIWKECLRVLKPGAFAFIMSIPRQDCLARMIINLEDAGFVTGFTSLYWITSQGLPKSSNISKQIDRRKGAKSPEAKALDGAYAGFQPKPSIEDIICCQKPLTKQAELTIITSQILILLEEVLSWLSVDSVTTNLFQKVTHKGSTVPDNVLEKIVEDAKARIGEVAGQYVQTDTLNVILESLKVIPNTNWNIALLWKSLLTDLLGQTNRCTIKMASDLIIALKILHSYLSEIIHVCTIQAEINQNGVELNAEVVESILISVQIKLQSLGHTTVLMSAGVNTLKENIQRFVNNADLNSLSDQKELQGNTVHKNVIKKQEGIQKNLKIESPLNAPTVVSPLKSSPLISNDQNLENSTAAANIISQQFDKIITQIILVAMKPLSEKTYVEQALANGKGITWLDDAKIPTNAYYTQEQWDQKSNARTPGRCYGTHKGSQNPVPSKRFPANVVASDDALNDSTIHTSGSFAPHHMITAPKTGKVYGDYTNDTIQSKTSYGDTGSFSRFFDLDAWWNDRLKHLPESVQKTFPCLIVPKAPKSEKTVKGQVECTHQTVKPVKLMSYLVTLGSREGDLVLDPFAGHGTTGVACILLHRHYVLIEQDEPSYLNARDRLDQIARPLFPVL